MPQGLSSAASRDHRDLDLVRTHEPERAAGRLEAEVDLDRRVETRGERVGAQASVLR